MRRPLTQPCACIEGHLTQPCACRYGSFFDLAWALHKGRVIAGEVRIVVPSPDMQDLVLWLVPHYAPGVHPFDLRIRVAVQPRGSCLRIDGVCRDYARDRNREEYNGAVAIQDDWRVLAMAMASHPRLGEGSMFRETGHDVMQLVLTILMRGSPPQRPAT